MELTHDATPLAAPFIGFIIGTVLFGVTLLQAYQYYLRYPKDSLACKLQVFVVCTLDLLHFIFGANIVYTFLITNFGYIEPSTKNFWSIKALAAIQATMIVFVQLLYLHRIYKLSKTRILHGRIFKTGIKVVIAIIASAAVAIGIVFAYEVQKVTVIPRLGGDLQWLIYLGYGAIGSIDTSITVMMCFVLYKNRLEVGINHISRHSNRLLFNLITYALASGLVTTLFAILGLVLYIARPDTFLYLSVMFSITRLYANSLLAMLNVRRRLKSGLVTDSLDFGNLTSDLIFRHISLPGESAQRGPDNSLSGVLRSRRLPKIYVQEPSDIEKDIREEMWPSAQATLCSSKTPIQFDHLKNLDRRFTL